jgi:hypothetical protein
MPGEFVVRSGDDQLSVWVVTPGQWRARIDLDAALAGKIVLRPAAVVKPAAAGRLLCHERNRQLGRAPHDRLGDKPVAGIRLDLRLSARFLSREGIGKGIRHETAPS